MFAAKFRNYKNSNDTETTTKIRPAEKQVICFGSNQIARDETHNEAPILFHCSKASNQAWNFLLS